MRMNTAIGKFFTCLAAMLLVALPAAPAFAADGADASEMGRGTSFVLHEGTMVKASSDYDENETDAEDADFGGFADDLEGLGDVDLDALEDATIPVPYLLEPPMEDSGNPTVAEQEQSGPKTPDSSREAIQHAATHIATPEQALTAKEATIAVSDPSVSLQQTGDSLMEGLVVALGGVVVVAVSLLLYHFRKE